MKEGGGLYHKPSGSTSFCCLLSLPSPLLLPGTQEGVRQWCWGLWASHPQVHSAVGAGSTWLRLPASISRSMLQCWGFNVPACGGTQGIWSIFCFTVVYGATSPVPQPQLSREVRCCLCSTDVVQGSTADAAWPALTSQRLTVGSTCTARAWFLPLRSIIFYSLIPDHSSQSWVCYEAQSETHFLQSPYYSLQYHCLD